MKRTFEIKEIRQRLGFFLVYEKIMIRQESNQTVRRLDKNNRQINPFDFFFEDVIASEARPEYRKNH
jgi:hypothetical protein